MKQYIYFKSWNGYSPSANVKDTDLSEHYKKFYSSNENKSEFSKDWLEQKKSIAEDLSKLIFPNKRTLSVGFGRGIIEKFILKKLTKSVFIHGLDPYIASKYEVDNKNLIIQRKSIYDVNLNNYEITYMNTVDYCLEDSEYINICSRIRQLTKNGLIISQLMPPDIDYLLSLKYKISNFVKSLPFSPYVFWGWHRTIDEPIKILRASGYVRFTFGYHQSNLMWIHAN